MDEPKISFPYPYQRIVHVLVDDIGAISRNLPEAKPIKYYPTGQTKIEVDWTLPNMTVLSQLLQPAVSTIFDGYKFPGKDRPFYHQLRIAEFLTRNPRAYCFAGMGTGKTRSACWAADYLLGVGAVKKVLVVSPKTLMYSAWVADIMSTCLHRTWTVLYGDRKTREKLARTRDTEIDIVNFDGVEILLPLLQKKAYDLIIIDESTAYKDPSTNRWRALHKLVSAQTRVWALTGTPTPQGPMDAYGQGKLITPERVPKTKTAFQSLVQTRVATFVWKNKEDWQQTVREMLQPAIYIRKEDCLDLPDVVHRFIDIGLSTPQKQSVDALRKDALANYEAGFQVSAANAAVLHGKLRQVFAGAVYTDDGTAMMLDNKARLNETIDLVERARASGDAAAANGKPHSKTLVFVPFKHALQIVADALAAHYEVAVISGDTSVHERKRILDQFQNTTVPQVIVAIPEAFSHGVTATAASLIVWYAPPSRTETYLQACERTNRPGQTQLQNVVHLYGDKLEYNMYQNLLNNQQNQETLLQLYHTFVENKK